MENENYSKSQIISGILTAIKNNNSKNNTLNIEESDKLKVPNCISTKFKSLTSNIPDEDELNNILSDFDEKKDNELFHKAGILAFLYNVTEIGNYNFASNLKTSTFGRDIQSSAEFKETKDMSNSELEKKAIQYDVALLSGYQEKVDEIMSSPIKDSTAEYTVDNLNAIDYEFINLSIKEKDDVLNLLKNKKYAKLKRQSFFLTIRNLESEINKNKDDTLQEIISKKSVWQSLTTEEKAINDFLDKDKKDKDFKYFEDKVMKKYSENLDFNEFLMKFGEVWKLNKENYVKRLFDNKRFDNADKRFIRKNNSDRTGFTDNDKEQHENLLASMHWVYITGVDKKGNLTKWGENDGKLLALLSKELVQHTKRVEIFLKDDKTNTIYTITHDDVCGKKAKITKRKYPQIWKEACDLLSGNGLFHSELKKKINESKTVGEAVFNVRRVFENPKLKLTKKCKNDFNRVLNEVLKDVKKENQQ